MEHTPSNLKTNLLGFQQDMNKFSPIFASAGENGVSCYDDFLYETWICHPPRMPASGGKNEGFFLEFRT